MIFLLTSGIRRDKHLATEHGRPTKLHIEEIELIVGLKAGYTAASYVVKRKARRLSERDRLSLIAKCNDTRMLTSLISFLKMFTTDKNRCK